MSDKVNQAGDVVFEYCEIVKFGADSIDIINQVESIVIYEDVFSPFITGELNIVDTFDLPNVFGRSGRDTVKFSISTPSIAKAHYIEGTFFIYKIGERVDRKDRTQSYTIYFTSEEFKLDVDTHISKKFRGSGDTIVKNLVTEYFKTKKKLVSDKASTDVSFVSNFWTPTRCASFVSEHSVSDTKIPGFLFFENRDGFNFRHIHSLIGKEAPIMQDFSSNDFSMQTVQGEVNSTRITRDPMMDYRSIQGLRVDVNYDFLKDYLDGAIRSKLYSSDLVTKKVRWNVFDMNAKTIPIINDRELYAPNVIADTTPIILSKNRGYGTFEMAEATNYSILQKRISLMSSIQSSKIEIDTYGRTDYTVGRKVIVGTNQLRNITKSESATDYLDRTISGAYMVTAIAHQITRTSHKCTMELCKESTLLK